MKTAFRKLLKFKSLRKAVICHSAEGGSRTHTRSKPRWILNPVRLPFRHFGCGVPTIELARRTSSLPNCVDHGEGGKLTESGRI